MLSKLSNKKNKNHSKTHTIKSSSYDQFIFVDSLTNRSIALRDMCHSQRKKCRKNNLKRNS